MNLSGRCERLLLAPRFSDLKLQEKIECRTAWNPNPCPSNCLVSGNGLRNSLNIRQRFKSGRLLSPPSREFLKRGANNSRSHLPDKFMIIYHETRSFAGLPVASMGRSPIPSSGPSTSLRAAPRASCICRNNLRHFARLPAGLKATDFMIDNFIVCLECAHRRDLAGQSEFFPAGGDFVVDAFAQSRPLGE